MTLGYFQSQEKLDISSRLHFGGLLYKTKDTTRKPQPRNSVRVVSAGTSRKGSRPARLSASPDHSPYLGKTRAESSVLRLPALPSRTRAGYLAFFHRTTGSTVSVVTPSRAKAPFVLQACFHSCKSPAAHVFSVLSLAGKRCSRTL